MDESNLMDASEVYNFPELSKVHKMSFSVARNTFLTALPDTEEQLGGKLWRAALRKVKLMLSVTRIFYWLIEMAVNCGRLRYKLLQSRGNTNESSRKTPGKDDEPQAPLLVANLIGFNLENYRARKRHFVGTLSDEMRMALLKSPEEKSDEDADVLQKLTLNMPAFMKYDHTVRRALSRVIGYGLFGKGRVIVRQVQKEVDNESFGLSVLESGDSFGELALLHDVRRSATIVTKSETELLWVNKDDFIQVLKLEATRDLEDKESFLLSIPFFAGMTPTAIKSLAYNSQIREVQPNAVLFAEGEAAGYVFIVREGTARLIKYVPFEEVYLDKKKSKYILLPHPLPSNLEPPFGSRNMSLMSSSIEQLIDPIIPHSTSNAAVLTIPTTPSKRSRKSTPDELSVLLKEATVSPFSLVSTTRVKCLLISRIDFARCCTIELAKVAGERIAIERRTLLDMKKLQETYFMSDAFERQHKGNANNLF
ncbi:hypothetical protein BC829DRAFT_386800 [Chytridium lagenaria]|nr:hypothetical protein BC829DRAFT_386800 [Chytridium lagenaria]